MEITRGNLDEITKPAGNHNNRPRPGSRVSLNSAGSSASYRHSYDTASSLEILPPEDTSLQEHDIEIEEFSSESEDDDQISDSQDEQGSSNNQHLALRFQDNDPRNYSTSSVPNDYNDNHVTSDQVNNGESKDEREPDPNDNLDPKIVEALRKMRQLDRILAKKIKREKEVKKQRLELHRQLQRELEEVKPEGRDELKEVSENTTKFLALVPPSSHNEGVPSEDDLPSVSPVFATQPLDTDAGNRGGHRTGEEVNDTNKDKTDGASTNRSASSNATSNGQPGSGRKANKKNKKSGQRRGHSQDKDEDKPDFIKRNIELATDAGNLIAMTDDEKKRLEELLQEVEMLADDEEVLLSMLSVSIFTNKLLYCPDPFSNLITLAAKDLKWPAYRNIGLRLVSEENGEKIVASIQKHWPQTGLRRKWGENTANPYQFQLQVAPGIGYQPDADEMKKLQDIDAKLMALMPTEDFVSISSTPIQELTSGFENMSTEAFDLGEKVLQETKQVRSQQERLQMIEEELAQMQNTVEKEMKSPRISDERLTELLRQCDDLSSRATSATSSFIRSSPCSPRSVTDASDTTEEIPKLPDDVLQHLLDEAREAGITTNRSLSTVNEEEEKQDADFESEVNAGSGRSTQAGALVSNDMIQELLKNPRATSVASSEATSAVDSPRNIANQTSPRGIGETAKTPVSSFPGNKSDTARSPDRSDPGMRMHMAKSSPNGQRHSPDDQRPSSTNFTTVHSQRLSYDRQSTEGYKSGEFESTSAFKLSSKLANISTVNDLLSEVRPPKTRGSSRIAFAEPGVNLQFDTDTNTEGNLPNSSIGGDTQRLYSIPVPPQISRSSPSPQKRKSHNSSKNRKSKSRTASRQKSIPSPGQAASLDQDLRLTSVSASASNSSVGRTDSQASTNTLVSSSDFEYENEEEVMQQILRATPGDGDEQGVQGTVADETTPHSMGDADTQETSPFCQSLPKLNRGVHGSKPKLPVDRQRIQGIENYAGSDDDSEKPFSPVFF